jgi:hypothetical protein
MPLGLVYCCRHLMWTRAGCPASITRTPVMQALSYSMSTRHALRNAFDSLQGLFASGSRLCVGYCRVGEILYHLFLLVLRFVSAIVPTSYQGTPCPQHALSEDIWSKLSESMQEAPSPFPFWPVPKAPSDFPTADCVAWGLSAEGENCPSRTACLKFYGRRGFPTTSRY